MRDFNQLGTDAELRIHRSILVRHGIIQSVYYRHKQAVSLTDKIVITADYDILKNKLIRH